MLLAAVVLAATGVAASRSAAAPALTSLSFGMFGRATPPVTAGPQPAAVADLVRDAANAYGAVGVNQLPVWTVPATQPAVTVGVAAGCNDFRAFTGTRIPIPGAVATLGHGDSPLVIDQPSTHTEWELWRAVRSSGLWTACAGGKLDTSRSNGVFPWPAGLSASGISYLATTITEADVASGAIHHVVAIDLTGCSAPQVRPANRNDCGNDPTQPPYGTIFKLPAGVALPPGLTSFGRMVFHALQTYGAVETDQAGAVVVQAESTSDWAAQGHRGVDPITASWEGKPSYQVVAGEPWGQLQVVPPPA